MSPGTASAYRGWGLRVEAALIACAVRRTSATMHASPDTTSTAVTPSTSWRMNATACAFRTLTTTLPQHCCSVQGSSATARSWQPAMHGGSGSTVSARPRMDLACAREPRSGLCLIETETENENENDPRICKVVLVLVLVLVSNPTPYPASLGVACDASTDRTARFDRRHGCATYIPSTTPIIAGRSP